MSDLRERLQQAVGATYRVERELGGGGMSRVFLAEETRLGRKVVIKILPPEMAAGVSAERFEREIQVAARLQHPHIVPLLTAGADGDLLYYVMPFIAGESLRAKLAREGELPIPEALRILREVLDALQYAHGEGVVHRDIKPDNVLLSGHHAVVTDFGVAKAVSASTGEASLTSVGIALGTPAYMAPEQAAAEPSVDHRADVYAVGALAYEMLSGRPPFTATTLQGLLAAQITRAPEPLTQHRSTVPAALNELVMRCLHKKPADRWQHAEEILPHLDAMLTPTMGLTPTGTQPIVSSGTAAAIRRAHPLRVAGITALAAVGVLAIVYALVHVLGLPDWVFTGAIGLLAIGVPLLLLTGHHERRRAIARSTGRLAATPPSGVSRYFTWKKAVLGSAAGFAGLALIVVGFMAMRSLGIGPAATAVTSGQLGAGDLLILAEFHDQAGDSALATTVTEAFRIDLAQSPTVRVLSADRLGEALRLTGRDPATRVNEAVAREVAIREGAKAVVAGDINRVGTTYVLVARVVLPEDGTVVAAARQTADGDAQLIAGIDRLSGELRERIGESLRSIRASTPLSRQTTTSLEALRYYVQATRLVEIERDLDRALPLFEEAVRLDPDFAEAYRKIGTYLFNEGRSPDRRDSALTRAYALRDRISERERYGVMHMYHWVVEGDLDAARRVLETWHERYPDDNYWLNNLGVLYSRTRRPEQALAIQELRLSTGSPSIRTVEALILLRWSAGDTIGTIAALQLLADRFPDFPDMPYQHMGLASDTGDYAGAEAQAVALRAARPDRWQDQYGAAWWLAHLARLQGRIAEAWRHEEEQLRIANQQRRPMDAYVPRERMAWDRLLFLADTAGAVAALEQALERLEIDSLPVTERPYLAAAEFYALAGRPAEARDWMRRYQSDVPASRQRQQLRRISTAGIVAAAEGRPQEWVEANEEAYRQYWCELCTYLNQARAYDRLGLGDSVVAYLERFLQQPAFFRVPNFDAWDLAWTYQRLGELYEQRGERGKALEYYSEFVELWKDADPELQPLVEDARARIARLVREES